LGDDRGWDNNSLKLTDHLHEGRDLGALKLGAGEKRKGSTRDFRGHDHS
jgi:hypothetical protein